MTVDCAVFVVSARCMVVFSFIVLVEQVLNVKGLDRYLLNMRLAIL